MLDTSLAGIPATVMAYLATGSARAGLPQQVANAMAAQAYLTAALGVWIAQLLWTLGFVALFYGVGSVIAEGGPQQATWGKRWLGLETVDLEGQGLAYPQAGLRFAAGALSWLTLNFGHAMVKFRSDRRALHDLVAGTQVLMDEMPSEQRMMRALGAVGVAIVLGLVPMWLLPSDPLASQAITMLASGMGAVL